MAKNYFRRYIWLIELLQNYSLLTLDEIKAHWLTSGVNEDHKPLADRTFYNNLESIRDMFGIRIACNRSTNQYYIERSQSKDTQTGTNSVRNWMMTALSINNILNESSSLEGRVLFDAIPSSQQFLLPIINAMKDGHKITVTYQSYSMDTPITRNLKPYCLKEFRWHWYLLAATDVNPEVQIYALDRIKDVKQSVLVWNVPADFNAEAYFEPYCGFPLAFDKASVPIDVKVKVNAKQRFYIRTMPIHSSQTEVDTTETYSIFSFHVIPDFYFKQMLISYADSLEILEPAELRDEMKSTIERMQKNYR